MSPIASKWRADSAASGHKWIVANDEAWPTPPFDQVPPADLSRMRDRVERYTWNTFMGGGEGLFQYLGYSIDSLNDISVEDFRRLANSQKFLVNAKNLFSLPAINVLLPQMSNDNSLVENAGSNVAPFCFAKAGDVYIVYRKNIAGQRTLNLTGVSGSFNVRWYSPRLGGNLQVGSVSTLQGGSKVNLGNAPSENDQSWAIIVTRVGSSLPTVEVSATDASAAEAPSSQAKNDGEFTFTRTGDTTSALTIGMNTNGSSATSGVDYESLGGTITIPAGATSVTRAVSVIDDTLVEGNESVIVNLVSSGDYNISASSGASVAVADNDGAIQLAVISVAATDNLASESGDTATFTFTRTTQLNGPLTVNFISGGDAISGSDYLSLGTSVSFADGQNTVIKTLSAVDDAEVETSKTASLSLEAGPGYTIGTPNTASATILDNDGQAVITVVATDSTASETGDTGTFTFTRSGNLSADLSVGFSMTGTADFGSDYDTFNTVVNFAVGQTEAILNITIMEDSAVEGTETIIATINAGAGYVLGAAQNATINIADKPVGGNGLLWAVDFNGLATGSNSQTIGSTWSAVRPDGKFGVVGDRLEINAGTTEGVFSSGVIDISGRSVSLSADAVGVGGLDPSGTGLDYVRMYVKINGGPETLVQQVSGPLAATTWTSSNLTGNTLQLVIRAKVTFGTEFYYFDNLKISDFRIPGLVRWSKPPVVENGILRLEWSGGGTLQTSPNMQDPWTDMPSAVSPYEYPMTNPNQFFRVKNQ